MEQKTKRWLNMVEKYGSEEAAKEEMRRRAERSSRNLGGKGGFASMDKEKLTKIAREGGKRSRRNADSN